MRAWRGFDPAIYLKGAALLVRYPVVMLGPLLASLVNALIGMLIPSTGAGDIFATANQGLAGLIMQLVSSFGLAVALIVADAAWRRGRTPFDDAWEDARRRAGDILFAALGFSFVTYVASLVGGFVGGYGSLAGYLVAVFFFIYALPAAAIGGIPGGASLQVALERARGSAGPTAVVAVAYLFGLHVAPTLIFAGIYEPVVSALLAIDPHASALTFDVAARLLTALANAIMSGYVAIVLAKTYGDISFGRRW